MLVVEHLLSALKSKSNVIIDNYSYMRSRRNPGGGRVPLGIHIGVSPIMRECLCGNCKGSLTQQWDRIYRQQANKSRRCKIFGESDERLLLCPPKVLGYSLQRRTWAQLGVDNVSKIENEKADGFEEYFEEKLELDKAQKTLLKAMIQNHVSSGGRRIVSDVVEGKGHGLVILLHGPPGVGKTLTAETVALAAAKPLLSVSTAEIGIEPDEAERNLTEIFEDASRWKAVLLMQVPHFPLKRTVAKLIRASPVTRPTFSWKSDAGRGTCSATRSSPSSCACSSTTRE
jgi:hypothetical protein